MQNRMRWFYLKPLWAYYENKLIKTSKNYKGNIDSKQQQSIGSNINKVTYLTPENTRISFKKLSF